MKRILLGIIGAVALVAAAGLAADYWLALPPGITPTFVGRQSCAECHRQQAEAWHGSDHDRAMDLAIPEFVLGDFNNQKLTHFGITSTMQREGDKFFVTTENGSGALERFEVKYVFGFRPLQQYLVEFPDGRVQALSIAWDTEKKRWFDLHPDERIKPDDELHWTKPLANWNYMCADCHSTNLQKNYDVKADQYHTTFSEIDVSCEACHGAGSTHVQLAKSRRLFWDRRYGYGLARLKTVSNKAQLDTCGKCHARRQVVHGNFVPGDEFLDYYHPTLLEERIYHADGQILDEVYEYGSFLQSRMHRENVKCSDCHDPHSLRPRLEGNQLCLRCHTLAKGNFDSPTHHHHQPGGVGSRCVECHMPQHTYMVVDPRRDHSLRVPRPDLTVKIGVPNACNDCHAQGSKSPVTKLLTDEVAQKMPRLPDAEAAQWAADKIVEWYGPRRKQDPHYGEIVHAGWQARASTDRQRHQRAAEMVADLARPKPTADKAKQVGGIVRATAVELLQDLASPNLSAVLDAALADDDPLVRVAAVRGFDSAVPMNPQEQDDVKRRIVPRLDDPVRIVRTEAARVVAQLPPGLLNDSERARFETVFAELREGLRASNDDATSHMMLGSIYFDQKRYDPARDEYRLAIKLANNTRTAVDARVQLAHVENADQQPAEAEKLFREVIEIERKYAHAELMRPLFGQAHYDLGLLLAENESRLAEAGAELREAARLVPENARIQYNFGVAMQQLGRSGDAEEAYRRAAELDVDNPEYVRALAVLFIQLQDWKNALTWAERLVQLEPSQENQQMFRALRTRAGQ